MSSTPESTTPQSPVAARPRIRAGAIAWGLIVIAVAAGTLYTIASDERREAAVRWFSTLTPGGAAIVGVLVLGGFLLLLGILAAIRHAQRGVSGR